MGAIISNIAAVFIIMGVGFFANKTGILPAKSNDYLSPLLILINAPCMVFSNIVKREVEEGMWGDVMTALGISAAYFLVFTVLGWFIMTKILKLGNNRNCGVYIMLFATLNNGFMGFPITLAVFGEEIMFFMVFFQMILMIFLYGPGIAIIHIGEEGQGGKANLIKAVTGPNTIAAILGLIVLFTGIAIPDFIFTPVELIGDATTPLAMIVIGVQLGSSNFGRIFKNKVLILESVLKMILSPVITFLLVNWLPIAEPIKIAMIFGAAFPAAVAVSPIAATEKKDSVLAAEGVALTTLMSLATLPIMAAVISSIYA